MWAHPRRHCRSWMHARPLRITQLTPASYRAPETLPDGGVLVVGAAATGVQLADELAASGRRVALAVGSHSRVPRTYRGLDICWWLDAMGVFARTLGEHPRPSAARREPSLQLAGRPDRRGVDLPALQARGVRLTGRLTDVDGPRVRLAGAGSRGSKCCSCWPIPAMTPWSSWRSRSSYKPAACTAALPGSHVPVSASAVAMATVTCPRERDRSRPGIATAMNSSKLSPPGPVSTNRPPLLP